MNDKINEKEVRFIIFTEPIRVGFDRCNDRNIFICLRGKKCGDLYWKETFTSRCLRDLLLSNFRWQNSVLRVPFHYVWSVGSSTTNVVFSRPFPVYPVRCPTYFGGLGESVVDQTSGGSVVKWRFPHPRYRWAGKGSKNGPTPSTLGTRSEKSTTVVPLNDYFH